MKKRVVALVFFIFDGYSMDPEGTLEAAKKLNVQKVKQLVQAYHGNLEARDSLNRTPLFLAVKPWFYDARYPIDEEKERQIELVKFLVEMGAQTNIVDSTGSTMYDYASRAHWTYILDHLPKSVN